MYHSVAHYTVRGGLTELFVHDCSTIIPERLDTFINKYAEHTHDKWAFEKVGINNEAVYCTHVGTEYWPFDTAFLICLSFRLKITGLMVRCWMKMLRPILCCDLTRHSLRRYTGLLFYSIVRALFSLSPSIPHAI